MTAAAAVAVEQAAIATATAYAVANGYDRDDRTAIGLVLAGMAIAARSSPAAQDEIVEGYLRDLPEAGPAIRAWADRLTAAAIESCAGCGGRRWVDDENWQPAYPEMWKGERYRGDGLIPCGFCNEGGWDTAVAIPAAGGGPGR